MLYKIRNLTPCVQEKRPAFQEKSGLLPYRYRQVSLYNTFVHIVAIFLTAQMQNSTQYLSTFMVYL